MRTAGRGSWQGRRNVINIENNEYNDYAIFIMKIWHKNLFTNRDYVKHWTEGMDN